MIRNESRIACIMPKKTNKTTHVLNLLAPSDDEPTPVDAAAVTPPKKKRQTKSSASMVTEDDYEETSVPKKRRQTKSSVSVSQDDDETPALKKRRQTKSSVPVVQDDDESPTPKKKRQTKPSSDIIQEDDFEELPPKRRKSPPSANLLTDDDDSDYEYELPYNDIPYAQELRNEPIRNKHALQNTDYYTNNPIPTYSGNPVVDYNDNISKRMQHKSFDMLPEYVMPAIAPPPKPEIPLSEILRVELEKELILMNNDTKSFPEFTKFQLLDEFNDDDKEFNTIINNNQKNLINEGSVIMEKIFPGETESSEKYAYVNIVEEMVKNRAPEHAAKTGCCQCLRCLNDIIAITLNSIPPKYVVTNRGKLIAELSSYENQYASDLMSALTKACMIVKDSPNH